MRQHVLDREAALSQLGQAGAAVEHGDVVTRRREPGRIDTAEDAGAEDEESRACR